MHKPNTFTDFIACAEHLVAEGWTSPDRLAARGGSAGGLLMGAAVNLRPGLFRAVVAEVPFVDCLTTMLDETLPLTVTEWEEWGDPVEDADLYALMKSYSPYDNVEAKAYPAIPPAPMISGWAPAFMSMPRKRHSRATTACGAM
jgi:oligopeptidase B